MFLTSWLGSRGARAPLAHPHGCQRPRRYQPHLESLEERLPPGDVLLAGLLTGSWLESSVAGLDPAAAVSPGLADAGRPARAPRTRASQPPAAPSVAWRLATVSLPAANGPVESSRPQAQATPAGNAILADGEQGDSFPRTASPARPAAANSPNGFANLVGFAGSISSGGVAAASVVAAAAPAAHLSLAQPVLTAGNADPAGGADEPVVPQGSNPAAVQVRFDLSSPAGSPFPSNRFTVRDRTQNTGRRVNLPLPDALVRPSDVNDVALLNTLDGFNLQPRLSIPFDGPINLATVNSHTVFLVSLGSTLPGGDHGGRVVGINQVVWDPAGNVLHAESDELLDQHTRYALLVTNGVRDAAGLPVAASPEFRLFRQDLADTGDPVLRDYRRDLLDAVAAARDLGIRERDLVTASVFTTESATAILEKMRDQIHAGIPAAADFRLGPDGGRTVFNLNQVTGITWIQQTGDAPPRFGNPVNLNLSLLRDIIPGVVEQLAFGKYRSPDYEVHPGEYIPPVGTRTGTPVLQGVNEVYFNLVLPSGRMPQHGWPVAIVGHGSGSNKNSTISNVAATMAQQGIATIAINVVGHGFGPLGSLAVTRTAGGPVSFSAGGRGIDQNADHLIGSTEGIEAPAPRTVIRDRDGLRQTVVDLLQLVRVIKVGMDVDGNGSPDLDPSRIYYFGQSLAGMYGAQVLAVEPSVGTGVLTVAVGFQAIRGVFSPVFRPSRGDWLAQRVPPLINAPGLTQVGGIPVARPYFNENMPLRNQPPLVNAIEGAMAIQEMFENTEWAMMSGDALAYIPHLRKVPLAGVPAKSIIFQFAKGDQNVPNPISSAMLRAGELADVATYYRHDLAFAEYPTLPRNGHDFMTSIANVAWRAIARGAQEQIAAFFASDGATIIHPQPARFFETPIQGPLPEGLNYIS